MRSRDAKRDSRVQTRDVACETVPAEGKRRPRIAVLTVHGIGEQVQFETLEQVAYGLWAADGQSPPDVPATNRAFDRKTTGQRLGVGPHGDGGKKVDVHLYEAYWAPLTEGAIKLHDVFRFLVRGSGRSLFAAQIGR